MNMALPCVAPSILDFPVEKLHLYSAIWWVLEKQGLILIVHLKLVPLPINEFV